MTFLLDRAQPLLGRMDNHTQTPPNPPSPADEETRARRVALLHNRLVHRMKHAFPGLPY